MDVQEEAIKIIRDAKQKIEEAELILDKHKKVELTYTKDKVLVGLERANPASMYPVFDEYILAGRYRDTVKQATLAAFRERKANRLEALAMKLEPDWYPNWLDSHQRKFYIIYNFTQKMYEVLELKGVKPIGCVVMSQKTANKVKEYLNNGQYNLVAKI